MHDTQSGFLQGRSIFDNIFFFGEMTTLAQHHKQSLAMLLLDFEKAYDKVDWNFLEALPLRIGFPCAWIKGVPALYKYASSSVLFYRGYSTLFPISRYIRQGCPLSPFLFILFDEAQSSFLRSSMATIQAIVLSIANTTVLDAEFADDTALYIHGEIINLDQVQNALQHFQMLLEPLSIRINL